MKSTQHLHLPSGLGTSTGLETHSGYFASRMNPALMSLSTSSLRAWALSGLRGLLFYRRAGSRGSKLRRWHITSGSTPFISLWLHASTSRFLRRQAMMALRTSGLNEVPILTLRAVPRSSTSTSSVSSAGPANCYGAGSRGSSSLRPSNMPMVRVVSPKAASSAVRLPFGSAGADLTPVV